MRSPTPTAPRNGEAATRETIRAAGLRATPQRLAVLAVGLVLTFTALLAL
jgi:hypothetical protein